MWTGIPVVRIAGEESERLLKMEETLHNRIIGQDEAITTLAKAVRRAGRDQESEAADRLVHLPRPDRGRKDGAGQGAGRVHVRFRGAPHQDRHVGVHGAPLGEPPGRRASGYVGYEEGGQLTEAVRRKSYSVILLDEIEKAHPEAFNMLLQIMEDGNLADAKGRKVDFRNTIIIMTSNVGAEQITRDMNLGFTIKEDEEKTKAREIRPDAGEGDRAAEADVPAGVPQPHRRHDRLPFTDEGRDPADRRAGVGARQQAASASRTSSSK